jgi:hypothetical protein
MSSVNQWFADFERGGTNTDDGNALVPKRAGDNGKYQKIV